MTVLQSYSFGPQSGGKPKQLVILLHGLGANGQDLIGLAPLLAQSVPNALFLSPDAPYPCDMAPYGRQWFSLQNWTHESMLAGIQKAAPILNEFIDEAQKANGLSDAQTALVGFSQGTMMSLYAGPRRPQRIAGILGYSGALVWEKDLALQHLQTPPVHLVHGDLDQVVPLAAYHQARQTLESSGFSVSGGIKQNLAHSIDEAGIIDGGRFLKNAFSIPS